MLPSKNPVRSGAVAPFAVFMIVMMIALSAFGVEIGQLVSAKNECQRAADAAALAALWEYADQLDRGATLDDAQTAALSVAESYAETNTVALSGSELESNPTNHASGDVVFGYYDGFGQQAWSFTPTTSNLANAIAVKVRRTAEINGEVSFAFARYLGIDSASTGGYAIAAFSPGMQGFGDPGEATINILPFAVKESYWYEMTGGGGADDYFWDSDAQRVRGGSDGKLELNMYPNSTTAGNYGTIDIGEMGNSTNDLKRQITQGVSSEDLSHHGGELRFNQNGEMDLNGDTGISSGIAASLGEIIGRPSMIAIFSTVSGPGNNANFTIVKFVGVRVLEVKLTGKEKKIIIQPAVAYTQFIIPGNDDTYSDDVIWPVKLVR